MKRRHSASASTTNIGRHIRKDSHAGQTDTLHLGASWHAEVCVSLTVAFSPEPQHSNAKVRTQLNTMSREYYNWEDGARYNRDIPRDQLDDMYNLVSQLSISQLTELAEYVTRRIRTSTRFMFGGVRCNCKCYKCQEASYKYLPDVVLHCNHVSHSAEEENRHHWRQEHLCWFHTD